MVQRITYSPEKINGEPDMKSTTDSEYVAAANCCGQNRKRAATTASSLEAEQDSGNINRTQSMATLNESFPQGTNLGSGPRYALTKSPTIYDSLIEQFWQTTSTSTLENEDIEITATIDGKVNVVFKASIRRHLKLADSDSIRTLPTSEISEQLALMGYGEGSTIPVESHHTPISAPSTSQPPTSPPSMQTTHVAEEAATMPYDLPLLRVYSLGSDEGSMTLNELMVLCTTLSKKVETLESDLKQTKLTYGAAYT
ncbi:hypothetical protein Tco_0001734 [Tanacetum coccineum]